jgi:hypothetical protein
MISLGRRLVALLLCLAVIGLFRGWFSFSSPSRDPQSEQVNISVSVDTAKVKADAQKAGQFTERVSQRIKERREEAQMR